MSVRAFRVKKIEHEKSDTFNLWHDDKLVDFLDSECGFFVGLTSEGTGLVEVPVEALQKALEKLELDDELRKAVTEDIEACRDDGYVTYYCF
ncbi:unnamed protein product [marine sediment metagenome]|uniref:Uncharacterized protein n=1 Tax=marine sediment metagenome TaxID=412755 RepID=X1ILA3_9ZZZZ